MKHLIISILLLTIAMGCTSPEATSPAPEWALAIHGGAGVISKNLPDSVRLDYEASLSAALEAGKTMLADGEASLDVVEAVVRMLEEDPRFNAGRGAVFTADGVHELDAAIMDGRDLSCGAVAGITTVRNPISLARKVMEETSHVFMIGAGAEKFADQAGVERVPNTFFNTDSRRRALENAKRREMENVTASLESRYGTVGAVALDKAGNLAAATSTGGMTNKRFGRVGDVPIIGAGTYANNATAAISATGTGEEFIRHAVAHQISAQMEFAGKTLTEAAEFVVFQKLKPGDGGIISVSKNGEIAMVFNSEGMFRGAADANGRFEVAIWE
jgi:beta-aspartyl-peptidase (threonine type)